MKRLFHIVMMALLVAMVANSGAVVSQVHNAQLRQATATAVTPERHGVEGSYELMPHDATQAAITHSRVLSTVCQSRPVRTVSTNGNRASRTLFKTATHHCGVAASGITRVGRHGALSALPAPPIPADYYVIALRRLLC